MVATPSPCPVGAGRRYESGRVVRERTRRFTRSGVQAAGWPAEGAAALAAPENVPGAGTGCSTTQSQPLDRAGSIPLTRSRVDLRPGRALHVATPDLCPDESFRLTR